MLDRRVLRSILDHLRKETNQVDPVLGGLAHIYSRAIFCNKPKKGPSLAITLGRVL